MQLQNVSTSIKCVNKIDFRYINNLSIHLLLLLLRYIYILSNPNHITHVLFYFCYFNDDTRNYILSNQQVDKRQTFRDSSSAHFTKLMTYTELSYV